MKRLANLLLFLALGLPLSASALFEQCKDLFPDQQIPATPQVGRDLCFNDFAIYYSPEDKKPIYTVERLSGSALEAPRPRRGNQFYEEARLPLNERALLSDYQGSGYDRGHNVPAGDMTTERGMAQSFSLANMMPQARQNNQGVWAKRVEEPTRMYAKRVEGDIFIFTGSTGRLGSIGKSKVTIPEHLFKLVYDPAKKTAWAYWVNNTNDAQVSPLITHTELQERTGIDFRLPRLPIDGDANPNRPSNDPIPVPKQFVGGWYPVFFDQYSSDKISELMANIQSGKVSSIEIQYDRNLELAQKIAQRLQSQNSLPSLPVTLTRSSPPESTSVNYERDRVTAIVRTK